MTFSTLASLGVSLQGGGGSGGTPGGSNTQIQYNNSGAFAGASGLTTNGTELTIASGTKTADAPVLNMSQTWNNGAVTFTGLKFNVVSDTSAAASLLMDLQVGGSSRFSVNKLGLFSAAASIALNTGYNIVIWNLAQFGWGSSGTVNTSTSLDTILTRRGAANLRFGAADAAAPVAQTLSVQSVVAGTTNTAGANLTITGSQGTGTGAGGSIVFQVAPAGSPGTVQNALVTFLEATSSRLFNVYGAFTDASNYERLTLNFTASNDYTINVNKAGTGSNRSLTIETYGNSTATFESETLKLPNNGRFAFSSTSASRGAVDLILARDAANTLALRNGTNAQTFNVYNTFTDASNYERGALAWSSNVLILSAENAGTGGNRGISIIGKNNAILESTLASVFFKTGGANRWTVDPSGHFLAAVDNTLDIGAVSATRPRSVYAATSITPGRGVTVATLPTPTTGMIARVTDASAPVIGTTVAGGGAAYALVNYNGANWTVIGV